MDTRRKAMIGGAIIVSVLVLLYIISAERAAAPAEIIDSTDSESTETTGQSGSEGSTASTGTTPSTPPKPTTSVAPKTGSGQTSQAPSAPKTTTTNFPYSVTVIYDGGRFIPDEVTVIDGGSVRFVNISDTKMWIASDNHPTHTRYPLKKDSSCSGQLFDQCASVNKSGSWTFTFSRVGTWGYHNHERARDAGSVRVMTKEDYLEEINSGI